MSVDMPKPKNAARKGWRDGIEPPPHDPDCPVMKPHPWHQEVECDCGSDEKFREMVAAKLAERHPSPK